MFEFVGGFEVIGYESLPLHNGEVNLNLIEATCVDRGVHEEHVGPLRAKTIDRLLAAVGRAVVHDPENATCWVIRLLAHDFPQSGDRPEQDYTFWPTTNTLSLIHCRFGQLRLVRQEQRLYRGVA